VLSQSTYTERLIPPPIEEETSLPSSDKKDTDTQTGRTSHKPTFGKYAKNY
jgi:hypothetical protein